MWPWLISDLEGIKDAHAGEVILDLKPFFGSFERKYGPGGFNRHHVLKSLVYFDDADKEPEPEMLVDFSWSAAKRFFVDSVRAFGPT